MQNAGKKRRVIELVFDSSVVLAILLGESDDSLIAVDDLTVNIVEITTRLIDLGQLSDQEIDEVLSLIGRIEPFTHGHAMRAAEIRKAIKPYGLSIGVRACLALALHLELDVYTADRMWSNVDAGCSIRLMR